MGQRLNVEIIMGGDPIVNCYFHWSGYSQTAADYGVRLIEYYDKHVKGVIKDPLLAAVRIFDALPHLSYTGATAYPGLEEESYKFMCEKYPDEEFREVADRNSGMISCVEEEMEGTRNAEEARITIDFDSETVNFETIMFYSLDEFVEYYCDECEGEIERVFDLPILKCSIGEIPFSEFKEFTLQMERSRGFIIPEDELYIALLIE